MEPNATETTIWCPYRKRMAAADAYATDQVASIDVPHPGEVGRLWVHWRLQYLVEHPPESPPCGDCIGCRIVARASARVERELIGVRS